MTIGQTISLFSVLISSTVFGQSRTDTTFSQKEDTVYSHSLDTMTIRTFNKKGKIDWEDNYVNGKIVSTKFWHYDKTSFGYYTVDRRKIKPKISFGKEFYLDGKLKAEGMTIKNKPVGKYKSYYQNGQKECDCYYKNGQRDSIQRMYFENGQISVIWNYKSGKQDGKTTYFFDSGQIWSEIIYTEGKPWTVLTNFDKKGNIMEKGTLKDGDGTLFIYDENGKLTDIEYYKKGKLQRTDKKNGN